MRLDGLGKPPLAQAQSDNFEKTKVQRINDKDVNKIIGAERPGASDPDQGQEGSRLGQIIELLEKGRERKKRKPFKKALGHALRAYQRVSQAEEIESQTGKALDKRA